MELYDSSTWIERSYDLSVFIKSGSYIFTGPKVAKHTKKAQDAKINKDAQEILNAEDVFAVEAILSDHYRVAQDSSKDANIENGHAATILSTGRHEKISKLA
jgi:hypothetical protein